MNHVSAAFLCALPVLVAASPALSGSRQTPATTPAQTNTDLPGVDRSFSIVTPLPPESDDTPRPGQFGQLRVGNFDVKVSGKLTFDVGVGNLPPAKR